MFKIIEDPQFIEDVQVLTPDGDGWETQTLRTRFRVLPLAEVEALDQGDGEGIRGVAAILERAVVEFLNLADEKGNPLDGTGQVRAQLLNWPHIRAALLRGYSAAVVRERLGNFAPSAASGRPAH
jgi:hypothetical protein